MKKIITFIGIVCLAGSVMAVSPKIKQYVKVVTDAKAIETQVATVQVAPLVADAATVTTGFTPVYVGQLLVGQSAANASMVWVAVGVTTSDWVQLSN